MSSNPGVIVLDDEDEDRQQQPPTAAAAAASSTWKAATAIALAGAPPTGRKTSRPTSTAATNRSLPSSTQAFGNNHKNKPVISPLPTTQQKMLTETEWTDRILGRSKVGPLQGFVFPRTVAIQFIQLHKIGMKEFQSIVPNHTPSKQQFVVAEQMVSRLALAFLQVPKAIRRSKVLTQRNSAISPLLLSNEQNVLSFLFHTVTNQLLFLMRHSGLQDEEDFCTCNSSNAVLDIHKLMQRVESGKYFQRKTFPEEALREFDFEIKHLWSVPAQDMLFQATRYHAMIEDVMDEIFLMLECNQQPGFNGLLSSSDSAIMNAVADLPVVARNKRMSAQGLDGNVDEVKRLHTSLKCIETDVNELKQRINNVVTQLKTKVADPLCNLQV